MKHKKNTSKYFVCFFNISLFQGTNYARYIDSCLRLIWPGHEDVDAFLGCHIRGVLVLGSDTVVAEAHAAASAPTSP